MYVSARGKRSAPSVLGDMARRLAQTAPVPWPMTVTLLLSPPNRLMLSCSQESAARWSYRAKFAIGPSATVGFRKPARHGRQTLSAG